MVVFFFKQKTAYEMRISDWSSDVCSSDLGVPHTVIVDNAGGHLMQHGRVDLLITGTDRTTATGDVANKIGTYLKALAAVDNGVPFYVALPGTRSEERRVGKECVSTCTSRWSPYH